jgi:hypothetical protein
MAVLAQTCMGVIFISLMSDTIFVTIFLPKPPADCRGPQFEKHWHKENVGPYEYLQERSNKFHKQKQRKIIWH